MMFFTDKKISPQWTVNPADLKKIARDTAIFLIAPALLYLGQLQGDLVANQVITNFAPSLVTIGAIQGWLIGVLINFFLKLRDGSK